MKASDAKRLVTLAAAKEYFKDDVIDHLKNGPIRQWAERRFMVASVDYNADDSHQVSGFITLDNATGQRLCAVIEAFLDAELDALGHEPEDEPVALESIMAADGIIDESPPLYPSQPPVATATDVMSAPEDPDAPGQWVPFIERSLEGEPHP